MLKLFLLFIKGWQWTKYNNIKGVQDGSAKNSSKILQNNPVGEAFVRHAKQAGKFLRVFRAFYVDFLENFGDFSELGLRRTKKWI